MPRSGVGLNELLGIGGSLEDAGGNLHSYWRKQGHGVGFGEEALSLDGIRDVYESREALALKKDAYAVWSGWVVLTWDVNVCCQCGCSNRTLGGAGSESFSEKAIDILCGWMLLAVVTAGNSYLAVKAERGAKWMEFTGAAEHGLAEVGAVRQKLVQFFWGCGHVLFNI